MCPQCKTSFDKEDFRVCPFDSAVLTEASAFSDPMIGRTLDGRFRIIEIIGQGGMGAVYKAVHTQMDRICAIKLLAPVSTDRESAIARFRREAKLTSRIDSPNAVTIYDFGEAEPGLLYLAMEYVEGESLADLLARERFLAVDRAVSITNQIARALTAAHSLGIVHRDLKPANIMLTRKNGESEVVKVLDFGIAKSVIDDHADNLTQTGFILGTPTYMSPEQVMGEAVDSRSDVYSLSIIVYQMLSGRVPFEGDNMRTLMMKRLNSDPRPLREIAPSVTEAIEHVIMSGLSRDPEMRIADVQTFGAALNDAAAKSADNRDGKSGSLTWLAETSLLPDQSGLNREIRNSDKRLVSDDHTAPAMLGANRPQPSSPSITLLSPSGIHERSDVSASQSVETISALPMKLAASVAQSQTGGRRASKPLVVLVVATVVILVALIGAGGYYSYQRSKPTSTSNQSPPSTSQPNTERNTGLAPVAGERTSDEHYKSGKLRQQQASSLAAAGSAAAAAAKNEEAIGDYHKAIESRPAFPEAHENLGVALYTLGQNAEAVAEYEIAIRQYEKPSAQIWTNYGIGLLAVKRFRDAAEAFSKALALEPADADLYYYRGFALYFAGERAGSREAFNKYVEVAPQGDHVKDVQDVLQGRAAPSLR
jgi:serine/threonine-protein kinase